MSLTPRRKDAKESRTCRRRSIDTRPLCVLASSRETIFIKRIADFLASLDNLIAAQTQKLDALKTHKRALMQQLFPAGESERRPAAT